MEKKQKDQMVVLHRKDGVAEIKKVNIPSTVYMIIWKHPELLPDTMTIAEAKAFHAGGHRGRIFMRLKRKPTWIEYKEMEWEDKAIVGQP